MRLAVSGTQRFRASWALVYDRRCAARKVDPDFDAACIDWASQQRILFRIPGGGDDDELVSLEKKVALCAHNEWSDLPRSTDCRNRLGTLSCLARRAPVQRGAVVAEPDAIRPTIDC
eukprot:6062187-Pyramimonas_sp.AAC.1